MLLIERPASPLYRHDNKMNRNFLLAGTLPHPSQHWRQDDKETTNVVLKAPTVFSSLRLPPLFRRPKQEQRSSLSKSAFFRAMGGGGCDKPSTSNGPIVDTSCSTTSRGSLAIFESILEGLSQETVAAAVEEAEASSQLSRSFHGADRSEEFEPDIGFSNGLEAFIGGAPPPPLPPPVGTLQSLTRRQRKRMSLRFDGVAAQPSNEDCAPSYNDQNKRRSAAGVLLGGRCSSHGSCGVRHLASFREKDSWHARQKRAVQDDDEQFAAPDSSSSFLCEDLSDVDLASEHSSEEQEIAETRNENADSSPASAAPPMTFKSRMGRRASC